MKKICLLVSMLAAMQLSAQKNDVISRRPAAAGTEQVSPPAPGSGDDNGSRCDRGKHGHHEGRGECCGTRDAFINMEAADRLSDKDKETFKTYIDDHKKVSKPIMNELQLRHAELKFLVNAESPSLDLIDKKLDEIGALEKKLQLEQIKFDIKVVKAFPVLGDDMR